MEKLDFTDLMVGLLTIVCIVYTLGILFGNVDAYMTNKARPAPMKISSVKTIPDSLTIDRNTINSVMDCHAAEGSPAYQTGYADACDNILSKLGLKQSKYRSRPSFTPESYTDRIIFNYSNKKFELNMSLYRVVWENKTHTIWLNDTTIFNRRVNVTWNNSIWYGGKLVIYGK